MINSFSKADPTKARKILRWTPKIKFNDLISDMIKSELNLLK